MESTQSNITDLAAAREAKAAATDKAPNLTAQQAAEIIIAAHTPSMVAHIAEAVPFRLAHRNSAGGYFNMTFTEDGGMNLEVDKLAVESRVEGMQPDRADFMILMGIFLIQQAEAALRTLQTDHLAKQLEELEKSGAVKLGPTVSPELVQMLATMQQSATEVTDEMVAARDTTAANDIVLPGGGTSELSVDTSSSSSSSTSGSDSSSGAAAE